MNKAQARHLDDMPATGASSPEPAVDDGRRRIGRREFVALAAALMVLNSLSTDPMLAALPAIGAALDVAQANARQWIVTIYFIGLGIGSLLFGVLSDRFGRRPVLLGSLACYMIATALCALAGSFALLIASRFACGFFAAASRVLCVSIIRDKFDGNRMARILSFMFMLFMIMPIVAPSIGQAILHLAGWRWIFGTLLAVGAAITLWVALRLPETRAPANRRAINAAELAGSLRALVGHREGLTHNLASGIVLGGVIGYIASVQQIFFEVFHAPGLLPLAYAGVGLFMVVASPLNGMIVQRFGARRLSRLGLLALAGSAAAHAVWIAGGLESVASFIAFQGIAMACFAFINANLNAIAMSPFATIAGIASSFQSFVTTTLSALAGALIGHLFDGSVMPLALGNLVLPVMALALLSIGRIDQRTRRGGSEPLGSP